MYLILIAWLYVALMMAVAEATSPVGSVLGALVTFVLYGLLPIGIIAYILGTPQRKRRLQAQRLAQEQAWQTAHAEAPTPAPASGAAPCAAGEAAPAPPAHPR